MRKFKKANGLPQDLQHWQGTVDQMLEGVESTEFIYLMIDQSSIKKGLPQRRAGLHVDGWWDDLREEHPTHRLNEKVTEGIILASSVLGGCGYEGRIEGLPLKGGDCSHIKTDEMQKVLMEPGFAYAGDSLRFLHESIGVENNTERTLVRLNVQGWTP